MYEIYLSLRSLYSAIDRRARLNCYIAVTCKRTAKATLGLGGTSSNSNIGQILIEDAIFLTNNAGDCLGEGFI